MADESVPLQQITTERGLKRPVDEKFRGRIAQYIYYKMSFPDASVRELATKMGVDRNALYRLIKNGRESGLLDFDDPLERIEFEIIPKVVDNLNHFLDAKDKTVTIEAAKGTIFRQYQDSKGISDANTTVLALKIEPSDGQEVKVMTGHIVGTPKGLPLGNLNET